MVEARPLRDLDERQMLIGPLLAQEASNSHKNRVTFFGGHPTTLRENPVDSPSDSCHIFVMSKENDFELELSAADWKTLQEIRAHVESVTGRRWTDREITVACIRAIPLLDPESLRRTYRQMLEDDPQAFEGGS